MRILSTVQWIVHEHSDGPLGFGEGYGSTFHGLSVEVRITMILNQKPSGAEASHHDLVFMSEQEYSKAGETVVLASFALYVSLNVIYLLLIQTRTYYIIRYKSVSFLQSTV